MDKMTINGAGSSGVHGSCIICNSKTDYFFSKTYPVYPGSPFTEALKVDYWKCEHCGFVISKTHQQMSPQIWSELNSSWHHFFERNIEESISNQPPYADQALALAMLAKNDVISLDDTLDYAAGYGTLSRFLMKYFQTRIKIFDRYVRSDDQALNYVTQQDIGIYKLVINSAMFEHVLSRKALDEVNALVAEDGVLMLHTVVCENIPKNPDWFYITPMVHTAFHTNKSMSLLMEQWGYGASVYCPQAKSWFLFKKDCAQVRGLEASVESINREIQTTYFHYKAGFVDYWKGF